jgi:glucose-1-phosphate adenylyltransferase
MERAIGLITANYSVKAPSTLLDSRPAAALPIAARYRMIDFPLSNMVNSGMRTVGLIMPYNYRSIIDHVESGKDWSLDRKNGGLFLLPGTAYGTTRTGARFLLRDIAHNRVYIERADKPYVILSAANIIYNIDLVEVVDEHIKSGADITVVTQKAEHKDDALMGFVFENGRATGVHQGVEYGDTAFLDLCVMSCDLLKELLDWYTAIDYMDLFEALAGDLDRVNVQAYNFGGPALAVFNSKQYFDRSMDLLEPEMIEKIFRADRPIHTKSHDNPPAKYDPGAHVVDSVVAGGARLRGAVEHSVLGRNVVVEPGATVKNSIILQNCVVEAGARVENAIIDRNNIIPARTELRGTSDDILIKGKGQH